MATFLNVLVGFILASCIWGFMWVSDTIPIPDKYQVQCVDVTGKIVYSDNSKFYPTVHQRNGRLTCIVKGLN